VALFKNFGNATSSTREPLSLSEIKSEHSDDIARRELVSEHLLSVNSIRLEYCSNGGKISPMEETDLADGHRVVPIKSFAHMGRFRSRDEIHTRMNNTPVACFGIQGLRPIARPGHFLGRSTSHSVAFIAMLILPEWPFFPNPPKGGMYITIGGTSPNERTVAGPPGTGQACSDDAWF
jgi:hypothetical protein